MTREVYDECHHHGAAEEAEARPGTGVYCFDCGKQIDEFDKCHTIDWDVICEACLKKMAALEYLERLMGCTLKLGTELGKDW